MQKIIYFFILLNTISFQSNAQNLKKAFENLDANEFQKAKKIFDKSLDKKKELSAVYYGLMLYYNNEKNIDYSEKKAYKYALRAEKYTKRNSKSEFASYKENYQLDLKMIQEIKNGIAKKAYNAAIRKNSTEALRKFTVYYSNSGYDTIAVKQIEKLEYEKIQNSHSPYEFEDFIKKYPNSVYLDSAKLRYKIVFTDLFKKTTADGDFSSFATFEKYFPNYPFYTEEDRKRKKIAIVATTYGFEKTYNPQNYEPYAEFIQQFAPSEFAFIALQRIISQPLKKNEFTKAIQIVDEFAPFFKDDEKIATLKKILERDEEEISIKFLSKAVNTEKFEYSPVISADNQTLFFCGRNRADNIGAEDIFISHQLSNGSWGAAKLINGVNTEYEHEAPLSISADGTKMLIYSREDVYYSKKRYDDWAPITIFPAINKPDSWEADAMITADGNAIVFVSDRSTNIGSHHRFGDLFHGGYNGNLDIYVSQKHPSGMWLPPVNLGTTINTPFTERSPFLHPDMKTLYFSSDGHAGIGHLDLFMSKRLSDTSWTAWSEPENLGRFINTNEKEYGMKISTDGKLVYYALKVGDQNADLCVFELPQKYHPAIVSTLTGIVQNTKNEKLDAVIRWENLKTGEIIGDAETDPETKKYFITLPNGVNYGFFVSKEGYFPASGSVDLSKSTENEQIIRNITLVSLDNILSGEKAITLKNVFFDTNKSELKSESFPELDRLISFLKINDVVIEISGHTDNVGSEDYNMKLSDKRAQTVASYLIAKGILKNKLTAIGFGASKPIKSNDTEEGRAENRRVEFRVKK